MIHLKLFEAYFQSKRDEIKKSTEDNFLKLKKEFIEEVEPYIHMISDITNNSEILYQTTHSEEDLYSDFLSLTMPFVAKANIKANPNELYRICDTYFEILNTLNKEDFRIELIISALINGYQHYSLLDLKNSGGEYRKSENEKFIRVDLPDQNSISNEDIKMIKKNIELFISHFNPKTLNIFFRILEI